MRKNLIFQFPKIASDMQGQGISLCSAKWPKRREELTFDFRSEGLKEVQMKNIPTHTLSTENNFWGSKQSTP